MWKVEKIINYEENKNWGDGFSHLGFHDYFGNQYGLDYDNNWVGQIDGNNLLWTIGHNSGFETNCHINCDIKSPNYLTGLPDGSLIVVSGGNKIVYKIIMENNKPKDIEVLIDCNKIGLKDVGNCEYDIDGNMWINEITGCRIWKFDKKGNTLEVLGTGQPGFQREEVSFNEARFNWIYDLRRGPEGNIYILDSKNYAVRKINIDKETVELIAGTGKPGYTGDGGDAKDATFGGNKESYFDGPWSLSLDEVGNIYVGDTQNHVVRMITNKGKVYTIAGNINIIKGRKNRTNEKDLFKINLPLICSMDYYDRRLYIPEWDGDLIILKKDSK